MVFGLFGRGGVRELGVVCGLWCVVWCVMMVQDRVGNKKRRKGGDLFDFSM
jgi:hypothetical protein